MNISFFLFGSDTHCSRVQATTVQRWSCLLWAALRVLVLSVRWALV